ncbi:MAG: hypothetical protein JXD23_14450 [Spirochaetales bacterium]|nr:hypothetical protein [Spirochaetales bacterium]
MTPVLKGLSAVCISLFSLVPGFAQDKEDVSNPAVQPYLFSVALKVLDRNAAVTATQQASVVTVSGKPIGIKLDGRTIQGLIVFTVYAEKNRPTVLLTQAQLLVKKDQNEQGEWVTILKSIPFALGQEVEFYPLGKDNFNANNLLFQLKIERFEGSLPDKTPSPGPGSPR